MSADTRIRIFLFWGKQVGNAITVLFQRGYQSMGHKPIRPQAERAKMADHEAKHGGTARGEHDAKTDELLQPFVTQEDMRLPRDQGKGKKSSKRPPNHGEPARPAGGF